MLEKVSKSLIGEKHSYLYSAFLFLQNFTRINDGNMEYQNIMIKTFIPNVMNILLEPINNKEQYEIDILGKYIERFSVFLITICSIPSHFTRPYLIQTGIINKLIKLLNETTVCAKVNILQSIKQILKDNIVDISGILIDNNFSHLLNELKPSLPGISIPVVNEIEVLMKQHPTLNIHTSNDFNELFNLWPTANDLTIRKRENDDDDELFSRRKFKLSFDLSNDFNQIEIIENEISLNDKSNSDNS